MVASQGTLIAWCIRPCCCAASEIDRVLQPHLLYFHGGFKAVLKRIVIIMLAMVATVVLLVPLTKSEIYICPGNVYTNTPNDNDCKVIRFATDNASQNLVKGSSDRSHALAIVADQIAWRGAGSGGANVINNVDGLSHFLKQLSDLATGGVTVYHFGDSHVRSAVFPRSIAHGLQQEFGDAGGAFCHLQATDSSKPSSTVLRNDGVDGALPSIPQETCAPISLDADSILSEFTLGQGEQGFALSYYAFGISGKTIDYFSRSPNMQNHLKKYHPDLVIITLGTNDAFARLDYEKVLVHLDRLYSAVRSVSPVSSILFTVPPDTFFRNGVNNNYTPIVRQAIIDFCLKHSCAWWDLYGIMGGACSMNEWREQGLGSRDRIHFSANGYRYQGEMISRSIIEAFARSTATATR